MLTLSPAGRIDREWPHQVALPADQMLGKNYTAKSMTQKAQTLFISDLRQIVQNDAQQRAVDFQGAGPVVFNEAQLSKFVHKMGYAGPRGADHLRKRCLADVRKYRLRSAFLTKIC